VSVRYFNAEDRNIGRPIHHALLQHDEESRVDDAENFQAVWTDLPNIGFPSRNILFQSFRFRHALSLNSWGSTRTRFTETGLWNDYIASIRLAISGGTSERSGQADTNWTAYKENVMPEKKTIERARRDAEEGKAPTTQAGEFVREEIEHIRKGKHGARSARQAIAIGLSKARRAGVPLVPPKKGRTSEKTRRSAERAYKKGQAHEPVSPTRSRAREDALKREPRQAATRSALSRQAHSAASRRSAAERSAAGRKAADTKGSRKRSEAAKKAARTRARNR
jgi:hypothetical protein